MFDYCRIRHVDRAYEFFGTMDFGIHDLDSDTLLMYSIVNMGGQWRQLHILQPFKFEEFIEINKAKGKNLKETFHVAMKMKKMKVAIKCLRAEKEDILPIVLEDASSLAPDDRAALESVIAEVF